VDWHRRGDGSVRRVVAGGVESAGLFGLRRIDPITRRVGRPKCKGGAVFDCESRGECLCRTRGGVQCDRGRHGGAAVQVHTQVGQAEASDAVHVFYSGGDGGGVRVLVQ